jgi:hypothetical protein
VWRLAQLNFKKLTKISKGMESLIKLAFLHIEVLGPHVIEGRYDLAGPDGKIILPQVRGVIIEPDSSITMHISPLPESPPPLAPPLPPTGYPRSDSANHNRDDHDDGNNEEKEDNNARNNGRTMKIIEIHPEHLLWFWIRQLSVISGYWATP